MFGDADDEEAYQINRRGCDRLRGRRAASEPPPDCGRFGHTAAPAAPRAPPAASRDLHVLYTVAAAAPAPTDRETSAFCKEAGFHESVDLPPPSLPHDHKMPFPLPCCHRAATRPLPDVSRRISLPRAARRAQTARAALSACNRHVAPEVSMLSGRRRPRPGGPEEHPKPHRETTAANQPARVGSDQKHY